MNVEEIIKHAKGEKLFRVNNTTGYRGVSYHKRDKSFRAAITVNGKKYYIGQYKTAIEAHDAYEKVRFELLK